MFKSSIPSGFHWVEAAIPCGMAGKEAAKELTVQEKKIQGRREFLSRAGFAGAAVMAGATLTPLDGIASILDRGLPQQTEVGLGKVRAEVFSILRGETFWIRYEGRSVSRSSRLIEVTPRAVSHEAPGSRPPFAIVFNVPRKSGLEQGQYSISHPRIGTMDLFMVPVDLPGIDSKLQAVFG
jgi:hypothetical protein